MVVLGSPVVVTCGGMEHSTRQGTRRRINRSMLQNDIASVDQTSQAEPPDDRWNTVQRSREMSKSRALLLERY